MINGAHVLFFSQDPERDQEFLRDVLGFEDVDAGDGWLVFGLPPTELATHPTDATPTCELYLACDDISATIGELQDQGVEITRTVSNAGWGLVTALRLPSGAELGLYEPKHPHPGT
ncbi:VOC family protein [Saccharopolyspora hordei]|uniref:Catechol 2,3-dioxygenase-like lactoylglutathione lyase family enzyme n=1 Tax=Saccharopolyspora hordei TaxID=1838 RepID=A0A853ADT2_9PSEU|nr:VOC family protein [Saccharopolyspora hordei]NYI82652.1 catechol 2,3-dioxygenase-like lactoylglutathione lyase family enzyme [Saccharopolyspora hordei]